MSETIELIYDDNCPHVTLARDRLRAALVVAGLPALWQEWERAARGSPPHVRQWASPTILVNGRDIATPDSLPAGLDGTAGCRVYVDSSGQLDGAPPIGAIVAALTGRASHRDL